MLRTACLIACILAATPALAEEREFCADRPGLGTPPCTLEPGQAMVEIGVASWEHTSDVATIGDEVTIGDTLVRVGVGPTTEVQFGLTSHVIQRERDRMTGAVDRVSGIGDGTIAIRQGLSGPNGPIAVQAFVTVPVARRPIGTGDWSAGLLVPMAFSLGGDLELSVMPEVDLTANEDRDGHHLGWGGVVGLSYPLTQQLSLTGEVGAMRDEDPSGHTTDARVAASLAWQLGKRFQLDFQADAGLTRDAPDHALAVGMAWQFR